MADRHTGLHQRSLSTTSQYASFRASRGGSPSMPPPISISRVASSSRSEDSTSDSDEGSVPEYMLLAPGLDDHAPSTPSKLYPHESRSFLSSLLPSTHGPQGWSSSWRDSGALPKYPLSPSLARPPPSTLRGRVHRWAASKSVPAFFRRWRLAFFLATLCGLALVARTLSPRRELARAPAAAAPTVADEVEVDYGQIMEVLRQDVGETMVKMPIVPYEEEDVMTLADVAPSAAPKKSSHRRKKKPKAKSKAAPPTEPESPPAPPGLLSLHGPARRHVFGANFQVGTKPDPNGGDDEFQNLPVNHVPTEDELRDVFETEREAYVEHEDFWRSFEWRAPAVHESLRRFEALLTDEEAHYRDWVRTMRRLEQPAAHGVGLGARSSFVPQTAGTRPAPPLERGHPGKHEELRREREEPFGGKCESATWLDTYRQTHEDMMSGERDARVISYICEKGTNCGGLADRLLGMTSAFLFALVTNRAFLAEWQSPVPADVVFDSPSIDWSFSSFMAENHAVLGDPQLAEAAADLDIIHFDMPSMDMVFNTRSWNRTEDEGPPFPGLEQRDIAFASPWIKFFTNRGMVYHSFTWDHLKPRYAELGLNERTAFGCILNYLFRPKPTAQAFISDYTSVMSLPTVFTVGLQIRTGDMSMKDPEYDEQNTVDLHNNFFRCANELAETYARKDQRVLYYLVTDSAHLKLDAQRALGDKLIVTDLRAEHVHQKASQADGTYSAVVEDWILAKTDYRVITQDSGFGKLASFTSGQQDTTVTIFPQFNKDVDGLLNAGSHTSPNCRSPDVFSTMQEIASEWSLG